MAFRNQRAVSNERRKNERRATCQSINFKSRRENERRQTDRRKIVADLKVSPNTENNRKSLVDRRQNERRKEVSSTNVYNRRTFSKRANNRRREDLLDLESHFIPISICGTGFYVPEQVVTNEDYEKKYGVSADWIKKVSGIETRRKKSSSEDCAIIGAKAAEKALKRANMSAKEIDLIILSSSAPNYLSPPTSCIIQNLLGANNAATMDINVACMGYIWALNIGARFIREGLFKNALIIASEAALQGANYEDKDTFILLGDGAGACILKNDIDQKKGILSSYFRTEGSKWDVATILYGGSTYAQEYLTSCVKGTQLFHMKGKDIFKFAVTVIPDTIKKVAKRAKIDKNEIDLIIPHQANLRILDAARERLNFPKEKFFINVQRYGNTSSASIAIALAEANEQGKINDGDIVVLVGFGAGLSWGAVTIRC